jgi:DNA polymerase I-like protein with 3'-5' exonuclease and polymerase domains
VVPILNTPWISTRIGRTVPQFSVSTEQETKSKEHVVSLEGTLRRTKPSRNSSGYFWSGEQLESAPERPIALDVETEVVDDEKAVPKLALASASDGNRHVIIHPQRLGHFLEQHRDASFVGHNVQYDFWCIHEHLSALGHSASRVLWDTCNNGMLRDTMVLDMLVRLAGGRDSRTWGSTGFGARIYPRNLAEVAAEYTSFQLDKQDPYRMRFAELLGLSPQRFRHVDSGFFEYALHDVQATHELYPVLVDRAMELMIEYGFDESAERFDIRPDAVREFGHLSEIIQVKASVVLTYMFRRGIRIDESGVSSLGEQLRYRVEELINELREHFSEVLVTDRHGQLKLTPQSRTPSWSRKKLDAYLARVADEIRSAGHMVDPPRSTGKQGGISQSADAWRPYVRYHRFLQIWSECKKLEKLLQFVAKLRAPVLHCQYGLLMRTGRTSCAEPRDRRIPGINLQQIPRLPEFRRLFVPRAPGHRLFVGDYAAVELRTLAAVCRARFGGSRLAEVIERGIDPHAFTAAAIQGLRLEEFLELKRTDPDRFHTARQSAKAINFGVPGGLGAPALRDYAEANYNVILTEEEAEAFRHKLLNGIYPELNEVDGYLADNSMAALARSLGVSEARLWRTFDWRGEGSPLVVRGVSNVVRGSSKASDRYQQSVWAELRTLALSSATLDNETRREVFARRGSQQLHDRLFSQSAATLTGRIRAGVGYTDSKNTPFQSLAADGAKLALWNLLYAGFDVVGFVHDEILVNLPPEAPIDAADNIRQIMEESMASVLGGVPAACEWVVADCWKKP